MLDLSTENKALCFEDSTLKPLYIFLYYWQGERWQYFTTIDKAIVMESMELDEGVLEGNSFELGSFVTHSMKVQWQNNGIRYKDMLAVPVQKIGDEYIAYFDGKITKEEVSENGQTVTAEISSLLSQKLDIDVLPALKEQNGMKLPIIVYHTLNNLGIDIRTDWADRFVNADYTILFNQNTLPQSLTLAEFLKQMGEFLGSHIVAQEKRIVNSLDDMVEYQPTGRLEIGFIRLANVDTVSQSNTKPLPSGYERLPYIQFNGNQYINTGIIAKDTVNAECSVIVDELKRYGPHLVSATNSYIPVIRLLNGEDTFGRAGVTWKWLGSEPNEDYEIGLWRRKLTVSGFKNNKVTIGDISYSVSKGTLTDNTPFYLGTRGSDPDNEEFTFVGKMFYCKMFDGDVLVRNFVPCARTEDGKVGFYDLVENKFYSSEGSGEFFSSNPIETHTLPYYINLYADKTNRVKFDQIRVLTETGDTQSGQRNYTFWWNDDVKTTYEIKNNIFFEALSTQYWEYCEKATREVGTYLAEQNLYYADLQTVYPPFIEGGDYLIVKGKNQNKLPSGYSALDYVEIKKETAPYLTGIVTNVLPDSNNIEIDIDFSFNSNESVIFEADAINENETILMLYQFQGTLTCYIGNWYIGGAEAFQIPYAPKNQKLNLKILCGNGKYEYAGSFSGNGTYNGDDVIYTKTNEIILGTTYGRETDYKLYHFAYSQDGVKLCDMYPCMRESDGAIGVYDIVQNVFRVVQGNPSPNYESADTVIPVLSTTARGIHSMRADILCKATNTNKN